MHTAASPAPRPGADRADTAPLLPTGDAAADRCWQAQFLRGLRENADRTACGAPNSRGRSAGLTQEEAAVLLSHRLAPLGLGMSLTWFRRLERLEVGWREEVAAAYADLLHLPEAENRILHQVTTGRQPSAPAESLTDADRHYLDVTLADTPAYIGDAAWDLRHANPAFRRLLPDLTVGSNIMIFVLTSQRARQVFPDWHSWAVPMLSQLHTAMMLAEPDQRLRLAAVVKVCLTDPAVEPLWPPAFDLGPNGDVRHMRPADPAAPDGLGAPVRVLLYSAQPVGKPGWRVMTVEPQSDGR